MGDCLWWEEYCSTSEQILKFESFNEIAIPNRTTISNSDVSESFVDFVDLLDTILERFLCTEDSDVTIIVNPFLVVRGVVVARYVCITFCMSKRILAVGSGPLACLSLSKLAIEAAPKSAETGLCSLPTNESQSQSASKKWLSWRGGTDFLTLLKSFFDMMSTSPTKNNNIQKRIGTKSIGSMYTHTSSFSSSIQSRHHFLFACLVNSQNFAGIASGDAAHVVVDSRQDGDGFLSDVDTGKDCCCFRDAGETFFEDFRREMRQLKIDVVMFGADASSFPT